MKDGTRMKKTLAIASSALVLALFSTPVVFAGTGNGAPSGAHFNLNLIGADTTNCPQADSSGGNVIFVVLYGNSKIELQQGTTFAVLDDNACTDNTAQFQLPPPTNVTTGAQEYTVWARVEGTPGGSGQITTCGVDSTGATICSTGMTISTRDLKQNFHNVTSQLTQVCGVINGVYQCVNIFDSTLTGYFWSYDNQGNKVLQLRFYPTS